MLRIGIDGRTWVNKQTGIGRYTFEISKELNSYLPNALFFVYSQYPIILPVDSSRWVSRVEHRKWARFLKGTIWYKYFCYDLLIKDEISVFWAGATLLPKLPKCVRKIVTVHDLNHLLFPNSMTFTMYFAYLLYFKKDVLEADVLITNSRGTADKVKFFYNREADLVVYPGVSNLIPKINDIDRTKIFESYKINSPYFLAVGTLEPRKNIENLIKAFLSLKKDGLLPNHKLILIGQSGWKSKFVIKLINENTNHIKYLGFVNDDHLGVLYSGCDAFVFPSVYEGFGITALEALSCGARILASDIPEIREACKDQGCFIAPTYVGIKEGLLKVLSMEFKNLNYIQFYSWGESAKNFANYF